MPTISPAAPTPAVPVAPEPVPAPIPEPGTPAVEPPAPSATCVDVAPENVRAGARWLGCDGVERVGTLVVPPAVDPSAPKPEDLLEGRVVAGVTGTLRPVPAACDADLAADCLATAERPAVRRAALVPENLAVGATGDDETVWIVVRDTGIGIADDELPKVFDRFYRSNAVRRGTEHGSGLGLGIVRELVERHGGTIDIDSEAGQGTTVIVALPARGPEDA